MRNSDKEEEVGLLERVGDRNNLVVEFAEEFE
jgi:hypothetical protein